MFCSSVFFVFLSFPEASYLADEWKAVQLLRADCIYRFVFCFFFIRFMFCSNFQTAVPDFFFFSVRLNLYFSLYILTDFLVFPSAPKNVFLGNAWILDGIKFPTMICFILFFLYFLLLYFFPHSLLLSLCTYTCYHSKWPFSWQHLCFSFANESQIWLGLPSSSSYHIIIVIIIIIFYFYFFSGQSFSLRRCTGMIHRAGNICVRGYCQQPHSALVSANLHTFLVRHIFPFLHPPPLMLILDHTHRIRKTTTTSTGSPDVKLGLFCFIISFFFLCSNKHITAISAFTRSP